MFSAIVPLLPSKDKLSFPKVIDAMIEMWPDLERPQLEKTKENHICVTFSDDDFYLITPVPMGAPYHEIVNLAQGTTLWGTRDLSEFEASKQHLIIVGASSVSPIIQATRLTQICCGLFKACPAAKALTWLTSMAFLPADTFVETALEDLPNPAVLLWVNVTLGAEKHSHYFGYTRGLDAFGLMNFEANKTQELPADIFDRLMSLSAYLIQNGQVIKNRDTVAADDSELIKVTYAQSSFGLEEKVMRLDYKKYKRK